VCGFVFVHARTPAGLPDQARLDRMDGALRHRGPDEHGQKILPRAAMGHRRLAIIDITGGQQPMASPDGRVWIVFNGEIYNFAEVRAQLHAAGYPIKGTSDTEVLLTAYLAWGPACLDRLNGMFAFAIHDGRDDSVFAARDRLGEKPLYVMETADALYLASELKAFTAAGLVEKRLDPVALYDYFSGYYIKGPRTVFRGVRRLQPGHCLMLRDGVLSERAYWAPPVPTDELTDTPSLLRQVDDLLHDAVRMRLVADVPLGFFLSGGVDSSAIVAAASGLTDRRLKTFSIGFDEARYDEREHARFVAERFGTDHHEFVLRPEGLDVIDEIAWHCDEPFADSSALPVWYLSKLTRQHVTVALSGDGGDEMFAGYDSYRGHILSERLRRLPAFVRAAAVAALRALPAGETGRRAAFLKLARNIEDAGLPSGQRFAQKQQAAFRRDFIAQASPLLAPVATEATDRLLYAQMFDDKLDGLAAMTLWQQMVGLPDDMLTKVDRMSMAASLEVRAPFLDHRFPELLNRVSFATKLPGGRQKYLLRTAMEKYLPADFLWRRKQGFAVPLAYWFKDSLNDHVRQKLLAPNAMVGHVFRREALERVIGEHTRLTRDWSYALWALLVFESWCGQYGIGPDALQ
jgi:asparagine synthase (glutamine-hydrolysing)